MFVSVVMDDPSLSNPCTLACNMPMSQIKRERRIYRMELLARWSLPSHLSSHLSSRRSNFSFFSSFQSRYLASAALAPRPPTRAPMMISRRLCSWPNCRPARPPTTAPAMPTPSPWVEVSKYFSRSFLTRSPSRSRRPSRERERERES